MFGFLASRVEGVEISAANVRGTREARISSPNRLERAFFPPFPFSRYPLNTLLVRVPHELAFLRPCVHSDRARSTPTDSITLLLLLRVSFSRVLLEISLLNPVLLFSSFRFFFFCVIFLGLVKS